MPIKGIINLPGDKSISHRALMLASLTDGECVIHNISTGEDIKTTRRCLAQCGIISTQNEATIHIKGNSYKTPEKALDCGNSGTSARLLAGLLAGRGISALFKGDKSLSKRPMNRIIDPLRELGVVMQSNNGFLPFRISPKILKGITFVPSVASAQIKSSILKEKVEMVLLLMVLIVAGLLNIYIQNQRI